MRPRVSLGAALTLGIFLVSGGAPFVLLPLSLFLLLSRPARPVTWIWAIVGGTVSALWLARPGELYEQVVKGWMVVACGVFFALVWRRGRRPVDAAITATLAASLAALAWMRLFGIDLDALILEVLRQWWAVLRSVGDAAPELRDVMAAYAAASGTARLTLPGTMMLTGVAGLLLAWRWYHWLADHPIGEAPAPFASFRFSDHFVWLLVLGLAGTVAQLADVMSTAATWPANLLMLFGGLYIARGYAVGRTLMNRWGPGAALPLPLLLAVWLFVLFLLPVFLTAFLGLGLADTWFDFRRPPVAAHGD